AYLNKIRQYEASLTAPEFAKMKKLLVALTADYEQAVALVTEIKNQEYLDFHARRLVEMAGHIIMSYLLLLDAQRDNEYAKIAEVYTKRAVAWNEERFNYIKSFKIEDIENFKSVIE
ncbi:MAG: acyl-CoA dehydrogenase, partial [Prevotellaceae bacterium]|nr:acyl-CoA dehydrogenase [Prevotellaceae bacterium]